MLQQYLPLAVLKLKRIDIEFIIQWLQQYLPLAVLKPSQPTKRATECGRALQQYLPLAVLKHQDTQPNILKPL